MGDDPFHQAFLLSCGDGETMRSETEFARFKERLLDGKLIGHDDVDLLDCVQVNMRAMRWVVYGLA